MVLPDSATLRQQLHDLYRDHHGWLQAWLRGHLGTRERAADIAQDTFLRLLASRHLPRSGEERSYLSRVARNLVTDQWRRQRIEQAYLDSIRHLPERQTPSLETRAMIFEALVRIERMLERMPDKVRRTLLMSRFEGLGYGEIAERLGVSLSSVQKYMMRAIQACYDELGEDDC